MAIRTFKPAISVMLFKNIDHQNGTAQRYKAAQRTIDLTPYLGDSASIQVSKNVYEPDGKWSVTFGDQVDPKTNDTLYSLIEPMDVVEIRGSRQPHLYAGAKLPLLMRGFATRIRRSEQMGPNSPQRNVVVSGEDWGKLWKINGVFMEVAVQLEKPLLTTFQLQAATGMSAQLMSVGDFMQAVTTKILNPKIQEMTNFAQPAQAFPTFSVQSSVKQGLVVPQAVGLFSPGPFWSLVKNFSDAPWNELWIDDSDTGGPTLVFRPAPYKDITGAWIGDATDPGSIALDSSDIISMDVGRSDERCANFFWTPPGQTLLDSNSMVTAATILQGRPFDFEHANNSPSLYGYRNMEWPTALFPSTLTAYPLDQISSEQQESANFMNLWHQQRGALLKDMNRDNVLLEDGGITARGREDFKVGKYLEITRGQVKTEAYLTRITHSIQPFSSWVTSLGIERGNGFIVRNKMQGSPYWAEGRPSVFGNPSGTVSVQEGPSAASADARGGALA